MSQCRRQTGACAPESPGGRPRTRASRDCAGEVRGRRAQLRAEPTGVRPLPRSEPLPGPAQRCAPAYKEAIAKPAATAIVPRPASPWPVDEDAHIPSIRRPMGRRSIVRRAEAAAQVLLMRRRARPFDWVCRFPSSQLFQFAVLLYAELPARAGGEMLVVGRDDGGKTLIKTAATAAIATFCRSKGVIDENYRDLGQAEGNMIRYLTRAAFALLIATGTAGAQNETSPG